MSTSSQNQPAQMQAPMPPERLAEIRAHAEAATICPNAAPNGRTDGQHTWGYSSFTHKRCDLCGYSRPHGERAEETIALLAEVARQAREIERLTAERGSQSGIVSALALIVKHGDMSETVRQEIRDLLGGSQ